MMSSSIDRTQFDTGSGERFTPARNAALVPCDENANAPRSRVAIVETLGSIWFVAAYATAAPAGNANERMDHIPNAVNIRDLIGKEFYYV